jgi:hypothetical protein
LRRSRDLNARRYDVAMTDTLTRPWRTGRKLGRTIYAVVGLEPSDEDLLIGMVDEASIAAHICAVHNAALS